VWQLDRLGRPDSLVSPYLHSHGKFTRFETQRDRMYALARWSGKKGDREVEIIWVANLR
jgi:hypothetical protein